MKISKFCENMYIHGNTILFITPNTGYSVLFMMVLLFFSVTVLIMVASKASLRDYRLPIIILLVLSSYSFYGIANSYQDYTDTGIYITSIFTSEHFYSFSDINKIETRCYTGTSKGKRYNGMKYNIFFKDGKVVNPDDNIKIVEYPKLTKEHKIMVTKNKVPYYSTSTKDPILNTFIKDHENKDVQQAIKYIFSDAHQITIKPNADDL